MKKPNLVFHGIRAHTIHRGQLLRKTKTGGFVFLSDAGGLFLSRLREGTCFHIERNKIGIHLERAQLIVLKKLKVITAEEMSAALKQAKEYEKAQKLRDAESRFMSCAKTLGLEVSAKKLLTKKGK